MKISLREGFTEERISKLEYKSIEINKFEKQKEKRMKKNKQNVRDPWNAIKCTNICTMRVQEERRKRKGHEEIMARNFPILMKKKFISRSKKLNKSK